MHSDNEQIYLNIHIVAYFFQSYICIFENKSADTVCDFLIDLSK